MLSITVLKSEYACRMFNVSYIQLRWEYLKILWFYRYTKFLPVCGVCILKRRVSIKNACVLYLHSLNVLSACPWFPVGLLPLILPKASTLHVICFQFIFLGTHIFTAGSLIKISPTLGLPVLSFEWSSEWGYKAAENSMHFNFKMSNHIAVCWTS